MLAALWSNARAAFERARSWSLAVALSGGTWLLLSQVHAHYPIQHWLFWRYFAYWLAGGAFWLLVGAAGDRVVRLVWRRRLPAREHFATAFALGLLATATLVFVAGLAHAFGRAFFVALPLVLAALGGRSYFRFSWRFARRAFARPAGPRPWAELTLALGVVAALLVYAPIMSPENISYDARWYHIPIAEHYAAQGSVSRFPEGWTLGAYPQLMTLISTWAMQLPFGRLFDRVMLIAHFEWVTFVATLAAVPVLVRRLSPGLSGYRSWLFVFLFPGLFLYDSNLNGSADHYVAATAPAIWLMLLRAWRRLEPRSCALLALALAAAANTKYTALSLVGPVCLGIGLRFTWLLVAGPTRPGRPARAQVLAGGALAAFVFLAATSMHWLKNIAFYGDPFFPALNATLELHPWSPDATLHYQKFMLVHGVWRPPATLDGVKETLKTAVNFAFVPHDWPTLHGAVPVLGMLFTLSILALPFVKRAGRLWAIALACELGIMLWYWTNHQDRYLQALVPWFAAFAAAVLALAYKSGRPGRVAAVGLVAAQGVWGSDVPFIPTHSMVEDSPLRETVRLLGQGYLKKYEERLVASEHEEVAAALPKNAKVLLHNQHMHLGLARPSVSDWSPFQSGLSYRALGSSRAAYDELRSFGVTHVLFSTLLAQGPENDSVGGDLIFWQMIDQYGQNRRTVGRFTLLDLTIDAPQRSSGSSLVMYLGCDTGVGYRSGLYEVRDLGQLYDLPFAAPRELESAANLKAQLLRASLAVLADCRSSARDQLHGFHQIHKRADSTLFARR
jgi:hypothetical protein